MPFTAGHFDTLKVYSGTVLFKKGLVNLRIFANQTAIGEVFSDKHSNFNASEYHGLYNIVWHRLHVCSPQSPSLLLFSPNPVLPTGEAAGSVSGHTEQQMTSWICLWVESV